jgi:hypothetical protein
MTRTSLFRLLALAFAAMLLAVSAAGQTLVYSQPHNGTGNTLQSSYWNPDGSDYDQYVWDGFLIPDGATITQIRWRGGYPGMSNTTGGNIASFRVAIYASIPAGSQPDLGYLYTGPIVSYTVSGNAQETYAGTFSGTVLYDYRFNLPNAFVAVAGTRYWLQIEAWQNGIPNWGMATGTGGNGTHFHRWSAAGDAWYSTGSGDAAFSLYASAAPTVNIAATAAPAGAGTITGAAAYPVGTVAVLKATPNAGWGFVNWTENGAIVSTNPTYSFAVSAARTLVANFDAAYTITTTAFPAYAGTTTGGGTFVSGAPVTVTATPAPHFVFAGWSDGSMSPVHTFAAFADMQLTAFFDPDPMVAVFNFDNGPVHASLPLSYISGGLGATFSATGQGFSTQPAGTVGINPPGFSGIELYPNSVYAADLIVDFSEPVGDFSILYATQELGCDTSATMRVSVYLNGAFVATATNTGPNTGSYPSNTLAIAAPSGFNRAVVHYDARPATCQDWGPIFLADNVFVTRLCRAATIAGQPVSTRGGRNAPVAFSVDAGLTSTPAFQWRFEDDTVLPPVWVDLVDGPVAARGMNLSVSGSNTGTLFISPDPLATNAGLALRVECVVTNPCGSATSQPAEWTLCPADYNADGFSNLDDLGDFITDFYTTPPIPGAPQPDAPTYPNMLVGFSVPCPNAPDAPAPYPFDAYRAGGYRVGYSADNTNACPLSPDQTFPNLDNLGDFITAYYTAINIPGC